MFCTRSVWFYGFVIILRGRRVSFLQVMMKSIMLEWVLNKIPEVRQTEEQRSDQARSNEQAGQQTNEKTNWCIN